MDTYEKKYKEALEKARQLCVYPTTKPFISDLQDLFPELKESEDEKIRKGIKSILEHYKESGEVACPYPFVSIDEALAWLEKQSEHKRFDYENANIQQKDVAPQKDIPRYNIGDVLCDKSCTTLNKESQSNFEITDIRNGMYICDKCSFPISQQDEYELVAKRIEQKSADKIEPKFKVGDWVVVSTAEGDRVVQIASIEYFKDGHPYYFTTEGRWFGNGTKARLLTDKDIETITIPESKIIVKPKPTDLEEFVSELSKQFPDVSFAKLSRIAVRTAKWAKPAWSEEDKKHIIDIIDYLDDYYSFAKDEYKDVADGVQNEIRWLQSIKQRL